jgi:hypothetical protein
MRPTDIGRRAFSGDEGVAMVTVLGVMLVVTLLAVASYNLTMQTLFESEKVEDESRAFRVASVGIDTVLASFTPTQTVFPAVITPDGTATITVSDTGSDAGEYEVVSTGIGLDGSTETVVQRFFYLNLWEMNFAGTGSQSLMSGSSGLNGSSKIWGPFYVLGGLAVESNMSMMEGPIFVKDGNFERGGSGQIGTADQPVRLYCDGDVDLNLTGGAQVYVEGPYVNVPYIKLPKLTQYEMTSYAILAQTESRDGKMSRFGTTDTPYNLELDSHEGRTYKYFGESTGTISPIGEGDTRLVLGTPDETYPDALPGELGTYGSWGSITTTGAVLPAGPTPPSPALYSELPEVHDDFAYWDNAYTVGGTTWDLLYISGTVFVDGPLIVKDHVMYIGNGTIVANGPVTLTGALRPFSYSTDTVVVNKVGEDKKWALGIVTPSDIEMAANGAQNGRTDPVRDRPFDYAGAFYTDGTLYVTHPGTSIRGSVISNKMDFEDPNTNLVTNPLLPTYLPDSLPGGGQGIISAGLWSRQ